MWRKLMFVSLFLIFVSALVAQKAVLKNSFRYGVGYGSYMGEEVQGSGLIFNIGYLRQLKNERLRLNPYFSTGGYGAQNHNDVRKQWFTSNNLGCNLWFDAVDETGFAITLGGGLLGNQMKGFLGEKSVGANDSKYVETIMLGGYLGAGVRIENYDKRFRFEILPLNFHFGKMGYLDLYSTLNVDILF